MKWDNIDIRPNLFRIQGKRSWQVKDVSFFLYGNYFINFHNPRWFQSSVTQGKVEAVHRKPWVQGVWLTKPERMGSLLFVTGAGSVVVTEHGGKWSFSLILYLSFPHGAFCHLNSLQEGEVDTPQHSALFTISSHTFGVQVVVILCELKWAGTVKHLKTFFELKVQLWLIKSISELWEKHYLHRFVCNPPNLPD